MHRLAGLRLAIRTISVSFSVPVSSTATRAYATGAAGPIRTSRIGGKTTLSLEHFLQRSRALALYRTIVRGTRQISDPTTRAETRRFAREEFERHRGVTDLTHIRYLISTGKTEWQNTERYIGGM
ncbi:hypothetical protein SPBR_05392 [Sporothrix brasiliensis 5110]|uniref:LYR motif-containing protein 2 n=1 Tax=Sporothrix brasiliensis 5110 TaxID=1398154 RepID=A0A0C2IEL1_9PEZI|nr:uncharacterized protein SPBR_05392 [Sporothrix brasiliensis 5110]KIH87676.1 hypothetical protein SPBR_05392 [Sporothrix brasiliensis 5110]